jgi:hypothetical protein
LHNFICGHERILQLAVRSRLRTPEIAKNTAQRLTMNTNPVLWLQAYIISILVFLIGVTAITEHPEWFN